MGLSSTYRSSVHRGLTAPHCRGQAPHAFKKKKKKVGPASASTSSLTWQGLWSRPPYLHPFPLFWPPQHLPWQKMDIKKKKNIPSERTLKLGTLCTCGKWEKESCCNNIIVNIMSGQILLLNGIFYSWDSIPQSFFALHCFHQPTANNHRTSFFLGEISVYFLHGTISIDKFTSPLYKNKSVLI